MADMRTPEGEQSLWEQATDALQIEAQNIVTTDALKTAASVVGSIIAPTATALTMAGSAIVDAISGGSSESQVEEMKKAESSGLLDQNGKKILEEQAPPPPKPKETQPASQPAEASGSVTAGEGQITKVIREAVSTIQENIHQAVNDANKAAQEAREAQEAQQAREASKPAEQPRQQPVESGTQSRQEPNEAVKNLPPLEIVDTGKHLPPSSPVGIENPENAVRDSHSSIPAAGSPGGTSPGTHYDQVAPNSGSQTGGRDTGTGLSSILPTNTNTDTRGATDTRPTGTPAGGVTPPRTDAGVLPTVVNRADTAPTDLGLVERRNEGGALVETKVVSNTGQNALDQRNTTPRTDSPTGSLLPPVIKAPEPARVESGPVSQPGDIRKDNPPVSQNSDPVKREVPPVTQNSEPRRDNPPVIPASIPAGGQDKQDPAPRPSGDGRRDGNGTIIDSTTGARPGGGVGLVTPDGSTLSLNVGTSHQKTNPNEVLAVGSKGAQPGGSDNGSMGNPSGGALDPLKGTTGSDPRRPSGDSTLTNPINGGTTRTGSDLGGISLGSGTRGALDQPVSGKPSAPSPGQDVLPGVIPTAHPRNPNIECNDGTACLGSGTFGPNGLKINQANPTTGVERGATDIRPGVTDPGTAKPGEVGNTIGRGGANRPDGVLVNGNGAPVDGNKIARDPVTGNPIPTAGPERARVGNGNDVVAIDPTKIGKTPTGADPARPVPTSDIGLPGRLPTNVVANPGETVNGTRVDAQGNKVQNGDFCRLSDGPNHGVKVPIDPATGAPLPTGTQIADRNGRVPVAVDGTATADRNGVKPVAGVTGPDRAVTADGADPSKTGIAKPVADATKVAPDATRVAPEVARTTTDIVRIGPDGKVINEPGKIAPEGAKLVADPTKVAADGTKVITEPGKVVVEGGKVIAEPGKIAAEGGKVAADGTRISETGKLAVDPTKAGADNVRVLADGTRITVPSQERITAADPQGFAAKLAEAQLRGIDVGRISQKIDAILLQMPDLKSMPRDLAVREIVKQLAQEGIMLGTTSGVGPKALEVIRMLLDQKLNPASAAIAAQMSGQLPGQILNQIAGQPGALGQAQIGNPIQGARLTAGGDGAPAGKAIQPGGEVPATGIKAQLTSTTPTNPTIATQRTGDFVPGTAGSQIGGQITGDGTRGLTGTRTAGSEVGANVATTGSIKPEPGNSRTSENPFGVRTEGGAKNLDGFRTDGQSDKGAGVRHSSESIIGKHHTADSLGGRHYTGDQSSQVGGRAHGHGDASTGGSGLFGDRKETTDKTGDAKIPGGKAASETEQGLVGMILTALAGVSKAGDRNTSEPGKKSETTGTRGDGGSIGPRTNPNNHGDSHTEQPQEVQQASQDDQFIAMVRAANRRTRYTVQLNDTLEAIAQTKLGDARFAVLILTINRGTVRMHYDGSRIIPDLRPGDSLWLPSENEINVHKRHFFGTGGTSTQGSGSSSPMSEPSGFTFGSSESGSPQTPLFIPPQVVLFDSENNAPVAAPTTGNSSPMSQILSRVRFAGNRQPVQLALISGGKQAEEPARRHYVVRLGDTLRTIAMRDPLIADASVWPLVARINGLSLDVDQLGKPVARVNRGQQIVLPNPSEIEQFRLMGKLASISGPQSHDVAAPAAPVSNEAAPVLPAAIPSFVSEIEARMLVTRLGEACRMLMADPGKDASLFSTKLQTTIGGRWVTIASYDSRPGKSSRHVYHADGTRDSFTIDLPSPVVKEMAHEDFGRNWELYIEEFNHGGGNFLSDAAKA